jgi:dTDP-4-amino-4,6-dideoxygalactose transaminase
MPNPDLALFGGDPICDGGWPPWPQYADLDAAVKAVRRVLESRCWTPRASVSEERASRRLERLWADWIGTRHALSVSSGSTAVEVALRALGIGPGQEVVVPALGWYATAAAVSRVGATPVFADVDERTSCLDPASAEAAIGERTTAVIAVHLHSAVADLRALRDLADRAGVALVEDAAQAPGAAYAGRPVGSHGDLGCFSFNQEKTIGIGEGGMVTTDSENLYRRLHSLRTDGYSPALPADRGRFHRTEEKVQGGNFCMSEIQAALLPPQIAAFESQNARRIEHAERLEEALTGMPWVRPLESSPGTTSRPYYEFGVVLEEGAFGDWPLETFGRAVAKEIGAEVHPTDLPAPACPQFDPHLLGAGSTPERAAGLYSRLLVFPHRLLLSSEIVRVYPAALEKVREVARRMPAAEAAQASRESAAAPA